MVFLVACPMQLMYLLRDLSVFVFAERSFSKTLFPHRFSFTLPSAAGLFRWQKRPHVLSVGPLGRSMQWCLLLIWAQGLRQAPLLVSGKDWKSSLEPKEEGGQGRGTGQRGRLGENAISVGRKPQFSESCVPLLFSEKEAHFCFGWQMKDLELEVSDRPRQKGSRRSDRD